jgi:hypothetical protein
MATCFYYFFIMSRDADDWGECPVRNPLNGVPEGGVRDGRPGVDPEEMRERYAHFAVGGDMAGLIAKREAASKAAMEVVEGEKVS